MIVYKVSQLEKIPENCKECAFEICTLPEKMNRPEIKKEYFTKRHKNCPLMELEEK